MKGSKKWSSVTGAIPLSGNFVDKFAKRRSDSGGGGEQMDDYVSCSISTNSEISKRGIPGIR
jgi:hypothetical protein